MALLSLIQQSLYTGATTKKTTEALQEAAEAFFSFQQSDGMSNSASLDKFHGLVEWFQHYGGHPVIEPICVPDQLDEHAVDPAAPTAQETLDAKVAAKEEYLAAMLICHSDPKWYGSLLVKLQNNHTQGSDHCPTTINKAYNMLINYKITKQAGWFDCQDQGVAFYNENGGSQHNLEHEAMVDKDVTVAMAEEDDMEAMAINNHRQLKYMYMRMMTSLIMKIGN